MHQDTNADRVWLRMLRLMTRIKVAMTGRLKDVGLSPAQLDVLSTLTEREGISQQELAVRLYVTKGNISGLIDRLVTAGLVERRPIPGDRRSHAIFLTGEGRAFGARGLAVHSDFINTTLGRMSEADLAQFERLLVSTRDFVREKTGPGQTLAHASSRRRSAKAGSAEMSSST